MQITVRRDNDPFKKYWWVLLLSFGAVGAWLCSPLIGTTQGSVGVAREQGLKSAEQSLDSLDNPSGAPGGPVELSMEGTYRKKKQDGPISSALTLPPEAQTSEAPAAAPAASGSASLAAALKDVSRKKDPTGWGGAKVQKAFHAPRASFGGLSGLGSSSGGGGGSGASVGAFGSPVARTGFTTTKGLGGGGDLAAAAEKGRTMKALRAAQGQVSGKPSLGNVDAALSQGARTFDGSRGAGRVTGGGGGEGGGLIASLDSVPQNLKENDPNLSKYEFTPPPSKKVESSDKDEKMKKLLLMAATMAIGGVVGGTAGTMIMMMGPMMMQMGTSGGRNKDGGSGVGG